MKATGLLNVSKSSLDKRVLDMRCSTSRPQVKDLNVEANCLKTFKNWLVTLDERQPALVDVYHCGPSDIVRCYVCDVEVGIWKEGDDVVINHLKWSPFCNLMCRYRTNNVPIGEALLDQPTPSINKEEINIKKAEKPPTDRSKSFVHVHSEVKEVEPTKSISSQVENNEQEEIIKSNDAELGVRSGVKRADKSLFNRSRKFVHAHYEVAVKKSVKTTPSLIKVERKTNDAKKEMKNKEFKEKSNKKNTENSSISRSNRIVHAHREVEMDEEVSMRKQLNELHKSTIELRDSYNGNHSPSSKSNRFVDAHVDKAKDESIILPRTRKGMNKKLGNNGEAACSEQLKIKKDMRECKIWQKRKSQPKIHASLKNPALADKPWTQLYADFTTYPEYNGMRYILSVQCLLTRFIVCKPIQSQDASIVAQALGEIFLLLGFPENLVLNGKQELRSEVLKKMKKLLKRQHLFMTFDDDQDSYDEHLNKFLKLLKSDKDKDWPYLSLLAAHNYNSTTNHTGSSPHQLMFGKTRRQLSLKKKNIYMTSNSYNMRQPIRETPRNYKQDQITKTKRRNTKQMGTAGESCQGLERRGDKERSV